MKRKIILGIIIFIELCWAVAIYTDPYRYAQKRYEAILQVGIDQKWAFRTALYEAGIIGFSDNNIEEDYPNVENF